MPPLPAMTEVVARFSPTTRPSRSQPALDDGSRDPPNQPQTGRPPPAKEEIATAIILVMCGSTGVPPREPTRNHRGRRGDSGGSTQPACHRLQQRLQGATNSAAAALDPQMREESPPPPICRAFAWGRYQRRRRESTDGRTGEGEVVAARCGPTVAVRGREG